MEERGYPCAALPPGTCTGMMSTWYKVVVPCMGSRNTVGLFPALMPEPVVVDLKERTRDSIAVAPAPARLRTVATAGEDPKVGLPKDPVRFVILDTEDDGDDGLTPFPERSDAGGNVKR